jgi:hypothetical protein
MAVRLLVRLLSHARADLVAQVRAWWRNARRELKHRWSGRPRPYRAAAIGLSVLLALVGSGSLLARSRLTARLPSTLDWRAAGALLDRDGRPGDAVVVVPDWLERAREVVPPGLRLVAEPWVEAEWFPGARRVWILSAHGVVSPFTRPPLAQRALHSDTQRLGGLEVTRLDLASPLLPLADLADRAGAPSGWHEIDGLVRRCATLVTTPTGPTKLGAAAFPLGRTFGGHAALLSGGRTAPVRITLRVDKQPAFAFDLRAGEGWRPFQLDTTPLARESHDVTVEVTSSGGPATLCLEALALP